ncbi:MAG: ATP-dependent sacrificial sulfur transferase LarE [Candidatus Omnitrophota bacterium]|nr:ATP-dependent sacrificial sulfur transferase LarE [Candidatus Omnitrophota bacterium]
MTTRRLLGAVGLDRSVLLKLRQIVASYDSVLVAFSGGVDSTVVMKVAYDILGRDRALAVTARSESLPVREAGWIDEMVHQHGFRHEWVETRELDNANYARNPHNRCYYCKTELYDHLFPLAEQWGLKIIANGVNTDDLGDWRPGIAAGRERNVRSPLCEAGINKARVRAIAKDLGLPNWDKPAAPCLSSRVPYGESVTAEKLRMIDEAEHAIKAEGFHIVRVRHGGTIARVEVGGAELGRLMNDADLRERISVTLRKLGFAAVEMDSEGYRQGRLNEAVNTL